MQDDQPHNDKIKAWQRGSLRNQNPERLAKHMIRMYGAAAAGKAIEMVRIETGAGNRDAAVRWHRVMSLIEEAGRRPR